jgi:hypothetical protein
VLKELCVMLRRTLRVPAFYNFVLLSGVPHKNVNSKVGDLVLGNIIFEIVAVKSLISGAYGKEQTPPPYSSLP